MTNHAKIYMNYFDLKTPEEVICEGCGRLASDIHHINGRGEGKDVIQNLMALCRKCHDRAHSSKNYVSKEQFQLIHNYFLQGTRRQFLS
jgi:5-methylcytosine-specific restriction endonuclease McrA